MGEFDFLFEEDDAPDSPASDATISASTGASPFTGQSSSGGQVSVGNVNNFDFLFAEGDAPQNAAPGTNPSYIPIPDNDPVQTAFRTFADIVHGQNLNPFATAEIRTKMRSMAALPEFTAAYKGADYMQGLEFGLENPELLAEFGQNYWAQAMDAMDSNYLKNDKESARRGKLESHYATASFFKKHGHRLSEQQRSLIIGILSSMPDASEMLTEDGVFDANEATGIWANPIMGTLRAGVSALVNSPRSIRPTINDPRAQLIVLADQYLTGNPVDSPAEEVEFFNFMMSGAHQSISEVESIENNTFFGIAQSTVGFIPDAYADVFAGGLAEFASYARVSESPDEIANKKFLSIGQQTALNLGVDPSEDHFKTVSGTTDAFWSIYMDPQNLIFGLGGAIKNAGRIPRAINVTKGQVLARSLNPFSGRALGIRPLPILDRSLTGRIFYSAMSRSSDEIVDASQMSSTWKWIARTESASEILRRFPTLQGSTLMTEALAESKNVDEVKELIRAGFHGSELFSESPPMAFSRLLQKSESAQEKYKAVRAGAVKSEGADFNLARLGVGDGIGAGDVFHIPVFDPDEGAGVIRSLENRVTTGSGARAFENAIEVSDKNGVVIKTTGGKAPTYAAFDEAGNWLGALDLRGGEIAVDINRQGEGIGRALSQAGESDGFNVKEILAGSQGLTGQGAEFIGLKAPMRRASLAQDGTSKVVVSNLGVNAKRIDLTDLKALEEAQTWLVNQGSTELAAKLGLNGLDGLEPKEWQVLVSYLDAKGADLLDSGSDVFMNPGSKMDVIRGIDGPVDDKAMLSVTNPNEYFEMNSSRMFADVWNKSGNGNMWIIKDIPSNKFSNRIWKMGQRTGNALPKRWAQKMRRNGFVLKHKLPQNISLVHAGDGAVELRDWIKALGGTEELALKWSDEFLAANSVGRKDVVALALNEVAQEIDHPMLKYGLIQMTDKQGAYTYSFGRAGQELGHAADGTVTPLTLAHMSETFAMPDAKEMLQALRRYRGASRMRLHRGLISKGTKSNRGKIVTRLKQQMKRNGYDVSDLTDEDYAKLAYSDVMSGPGVRGTGAGRVSRAASIPVNIVKGFGSVFMVAQLAGRPIAWAARVLMEEGVRADLMGMPSVWANPFEYVGFWMDARAIRKLPDSMAAQGKVAAEVVDTIFDGGKLNVDELQKFLPDLTIDNSWTRGDVAHIVGRELRGGDIATMGMLGARSNVTKRAWLRSRRIKANQARVEKYKSLDDAFSWRIDGAEIANRTFYQAYMKEAGSATVPMEWSKTAMTPDGITSFGRGYGRQIDQMMSDPIVGAYGVSRMRARMLGQPQDAVYNAEKLVESAHWPDLERLVDRKLGGDGVGAGMGRVQKAQWYLDNVVDEISETLYRPLLQDMSTDAGAEALSALKKGSGEIVLADQVITLNRSHYETFVDQIGEVAQTAFENGSDMPVRMSVYFDPRFGQRIPESRWRAASDWMLQRFGENASQHLNRQPAYLATQSKYYRHYREMGWETEVARRAASEKAAEMVNYVFFDNAHIPTFLHDANQIMPFFSAMFEVSQTWAYKIPNMNVYGVGLAQLTRKVDRTLQGLVKSGLVTYDPETGSMVLTATNDLDNVDPGTRMVSNTLYQFMRAPITTLEVLGGMASLADEGGYEMADFSAWTKDGFKINVGNPLDPTSYGLGAVNQFSVGLTPFLQFGASQAANRAYAWDDKSVSPTEDTVGEYVANSDTEEGALLYYNKDAFIEKNGREAYNQALAGTVDVLDLKMPDVIRVPQTSWWETMLDRTIFPFGKLNSMGQTIASVSPAAMGYVFRSAGLSMMGEDEGSGFFEFFLGNMSNYQVGAEKIIQAQMLEASEGLLTRERLLNEKIQKLVADNNLTVLANPSGASSVAGADSEGAAEVQELLYDQHRLNLEITRRVEGNAAGALLSRGLLGQLGPVTPRMFTKEQEQAAIYWSGKDLAEEVAKINGNPDLASVINSKNINSVEDMTLLAGTVGAWLEDDSGDAAKVWVKENNPSMMAYLQGKSFYGDIGFHPETEGFDRWAADVESGAIKSVPTDVFVQRYNRASISADKQVAIIDRYGKDLDTATTTILSNWDDYKTNIGDVYDIKYASLDYLDAYLYESSLSNYDKRGGPDSLSQYALLTEKLRDAQQVVDDLDDLLRYTDLEPGELRGIKGALRSAIADYRTNLDNLREFRPDYDNPLEENIGTYFEIVSSGYYDARATIYEEEIEVAQNADERSLGYEQLRVLDNDTFLAQHTMESASGSMINVIDPISRSWNGKSPQEREEKIISNIGKPGRWLNLFEVEVIKEFAPAAAPYLPTIHSMKIHDAATRQKTDLDRYARQNPREITPYQVGLEKKEIDEWVVEELLRLRRSGELEYEKAVPIRKMEMVGMLPDTLKQVAGMTNQIIGELQANDPPKSPSSNLGRIYFLELVDYLNSVYYRQNPQAELDLMQLGNVMFGEALPDGVYARVLQGRFPMSARLK